MIRAYVNYASYGGGVHVSLVQLNESDETIPRRILRFKPAGEGDRTFIAHTWEQIDPLEATEPTLTLDHEEANAIMRGLTEFYGGVDNERLLRRDYDAERGRVDKLTEAVIEIARRGAHG